MNDFDLEKGQKWSDLYRKKYGEPPIIFVNALREALGLDNIPAHEGQRSGNWFDDEHCLNHYLSMVPDGNRRVNSIRY